MIEVNVDNLSADLESRHCTLPSPGSAGPVVVKVNTFYSLYSTYSVWCPAICAWWRDKAGRRRAWSSPQSAQTTIDSVQDEVSDG